MNETILRSMVKWYWEGKIGVLGENPVTVPNFPTQILYDLTWDRNWTSVRGLSLPFYSYVYPSLCYANQPKAFFLAGEGYRVIIIIRISVNRTARRLEWLVGKYTARGEVRVRERQGGINPWDLFFLFSYWYALPNYVTADHKICWNSTSWFNPWVGDRIFNGYV
jgi:hypothetical protein